MDTSEEKYYRKCLRCKERQVIVACGNCGGTKLGRGENNEGTLGLFCEQCERGYTRWTCLSCKTNNPIAKTIVYWNSAFKNDD